MRRHHPVGVEGGTARVVGAQQPIRLGRRCLAIRVTQFVERHPIRSPGEGERKFLDDKGALLLQRDAKAWRHVGGGLQVLGWGRVRLVNPDLLGHYTVAPNIPCTSATISIV